FTKNPLCESFLHFQPNRHFTNFSSPKRPEAQSMRFKRQIPAEAISTCIILQYSSPVSSVLLHLDGVARKFLHLLFSACSTHAPARDPRTFLTLSLPWVLFDHAEPQIGSRRGREDSHSFQFQLLIGERLEKAQPFPQEDRNDAKMASIDP